MDCQQFESSDKRFLRGQRLDGVDGRALKESGRLQDVHRHGDHGLDERFLVLRWLRQRALTVFNLLQLLVDGIAVFCIQG